MSYRCNTCLYIFTDKKNNCPFCGGRIIENTCDESELFDEGFSYAPSENENQAHDSDSQSSDQFSKLYDSYVKEHFSNTPNTNSNYQDQTVSSEKQSSNSVDFEDSISSSSSSNGYFGQFTGGLSEQQISPVIEKPMPDTSTVSSTYYDAEYEREMNRLRAQQHRLEREQRRLEFSNFLHNISFRNLFRFLLILCCAILLIVIWNNRDEIINAITDLIISLLPLALVIGGIVHYIKKLFKK